MFKLRSGAQLVRDGLHFTTVLDGEKIVLDGAVTTAMTNGVFDADGAVFFQRELEHIKAKSYDVQFPALQARSLFPVSNDGGAGVTTITYRTYDQSGAAEIITAYAKDLPRADVAGKETTIPVRSVGISFGYNLDEIQASQLTGRSLDQRKAEAARRAVEQKINDIAFIGDAASGLVGLFSHPNIPTGAVVNGGSGTAWSTKTPDQILFDINDLFGDVFEATNMVERANTLLLPPQQYNYIAGTPRSANSDTTILQYIVNNSPFLRSLDDVIPVNECAAINNPLLSTDAMVGYDRSPDKVQLEIPVELEMQPVQQVGLEFTVPARARVGGLNVYYPLAFAIGTGI